MTKFRFPAVAFLSAALALAACGDAPSGADTAQITRQQVAGSYRFSREYGATVFTTTENGVTIDRLDEGASMQIDLAADGSTTGRFVVPRGKEDGGNFEADMAGRWTLKGDTVRFEQNADTFIRDMPFLVHGNRLEGDRTFSGMRIRMTLGKL